MTQQAGELRFTTVVQLLELRSGEQLVRFAYARDGVARRGPVTLRRRDLERLGAALATKRELADALGAVGAPKQGARPATGRGGGA